MYVLTSFSLNSIIFFNSLQYTHYLKINECKRLKQEMPQSALDFRNFFFQCQQHNPGLTLEMCKYAYMICIYSIYVCAFVKFLFFLLLFIYIDLCNVSLGTYLQLYICLFVCLLVNTRVAFLQRRPISSIKMQ